ncbi:hypothetical protein T459_09007 [Capsicum annuum]|uniref:SET domain-containing protein n=1 Tax=Capsicum annuum TaxID=4072 RepID=A0A2G2ZY74_CAPAN|nr:hypothetical protein T459_09007 [Capsicum annuum]
MAVVRMQAPEVKGPVHEPGNALTSSLEQVKVGQAVYVAGSLFNHSCQPNIHAYFLSRTLYVQSTEYIIAGTELELSYGPQVGQWDCKDRQRLLEDRYSFTCQCTGCSELNVPDLVINAYRCTKLNCLGVILDRTVAGCEKRKLKLLPDASTVYCSSPHKKVEKLNDANISEVARHVLESDYKLEPQHCLVCDSYRDLEASCAAASQADSCYKRLQDAIALNEVQSNVLLDAVRCTDLLRTVFHPYNKRIAEMEDHLAQAFYLVGELQAAIDHCKASIQILEKLYDANHIAIGNELIKLASLQILMGNSAASNSISRITAIFSRYYGSHADDIYPYLRLLKGRSLILDLPWDNAYCGPVPVLLDSHRFNLAILPHTDSLSIFWVQYHRSWETKSLSDQPRAYLLEPERTFILLPHSFELDDRLTFVEEPVTILVRDIRGLHSMELPMVNVQWRHRPVEEANWETKHDIRA